MKKIKKKSGELFHAFQIELEKVFLTEYRCKYVNDAFVNVFVKFPFCQARPLWVILTSGTADSKVLLGGDFFFPFKIYFSDIFITLPLLLKSTINAAQLIVL